MSRREFIAFLGGATVAWPLTAGAQQPARASRLGVITGFTENDPQSRARIAALLRQLRELGWTDDNLQIDFRFAGNNLERMYTFASELVAKMPDVILSQSTPGLLAVRKATLTIPTVFVQVADTDLIEAGITGTLASPGGNVTGFTNYEVSMGTKWLQILKQAAPAVTRVAVLMHPATSSQLAYLAAAQAASNALGVVVTPAFVRDQSEIESAITEFAREPNGGLIALPHNMTAQHRDVIADLALRYRLPTLGAFRYMAESGCLISYGIDVADLFRRSGVYIDRILKGIKPADLPIQQPTKYEMVINLRTATVLGLTVPATLVGVADELIE